MTRFERLAAVVDRTRGRSEVHDHIRSLEAVRPRPWLRYIRLDESKRRIDMDVREVRSRSGNEVIDSDDAITVSEKSIDEMRTEKSRSAGHKNVHALIVRRPGP
jgi:hypothetical protein